MIIDNIDFHELECMKYWQPPSSWSEEKRKTEVKNRIFSDEWLGARKMDGALYKFTKDMNGNMELTGRSKSVNGDYLNKIDWVPQFHDFFDALPNGTCLLGEVVFPENEGSRNTTTIMGCLVDKAISRQETGAKLHYYVFDILAYNGKSLLKETFLNRINLLNKCANIYFYDYIDFAKYYHGKELWNKLQEILADGGEGIVITKDTALYEPGKRPSKTTLKIKKELRQTIDCVIIGANAPTKEYTGKDITNWTYWINDRTGERLSGSYYMEYYRDQELTPVTKSYFYKWCGSFKIGLYKDGKIIHVGDLSGLTDEMRENWRDYIGKVVEVGGMEVMTDTLGIRHPKLIEIREDKEPKDCNYEQLFQ